MGKAARAAPRQTCVFFFFCVLKILFLFLSENLDFVLEVESQWSRPVLPGAAQSHTEITGRDDGSMRSF